jgi:hypothetical protein
MQFTAKLIQSDGNRMTPNRFDPFKDAFNCPWAFQAEVRRGWSTLLYPGQRNRLGKTGRL